MTYVGIKLSRVLVKNVHHQNQGMDAGVVFRPILFKTLPELNEHHPYGPYCNLKDGRNPIFAKVTGIVSRVHAKSGTRQLISEYI
jgi:hypothetical protein